MQLDNPLIVQSDRTLLLDVHAPLADKCRNELIPFAELERSPEHLHTYRLTPLSLWNASSAGFMTGPLLSSYYASKNYVVRLSLAIAQELKKTKSKVRISIFCPGPVDTNFNNRAGVVFSVKPISADFAAKYAIDNALSGRTVIIPTFKMKLGVLGAKLAPEKILSSVTYTIQKKKLK